MKVNALVMKPSDNVGTVIVDLQKGDSAVMQAGGEVKAVRLQEDVPFGFKFSLNFIKAGEPVVKYGVQIGLASTDIEPGVVVHVHNCEGARGRGDLDSK